MKAHPFERTLGPGPYRVVGFFALVIPSEHNHGRNNFHLAPATKSGCGTCAHCGHGIINNYIVQNGLGERFAIGSDCVLAANGGVELSFFEKHQRAMKREHGRQYRERRREKLAREINTLIQKHSLALRSLPHPSEFHPGKSAYDYCLFVYRNGHLSANASLELKRKICGWLPEIARTA